MSQDNPIVIPVPFHGDTITAVETPDGVMVAVKSICERLGLDWKSQHRKLAANPRWGMVILRIPSAGGVQETTCIPIWKFFGWMTDITVSRVKPELRERLALYQEEADAVLDRHFRLRVAETSARIEELERMLWHSHQQLRIDNPKWGRTYVMMEQGHSDYMIAQRNNWTMERERTEVEGMKHCGMTPRWREDMQTLMDENSDLRWKLRRQRDLFDA